MEFCRGFYRELWWRTFERSAYVGIENPHPVVVTEVPPFHGMGRPYEVRIPMELYKEYSDTNDAGTNPSLDLANPRQMIPFIVSNLIFPGLEKSSSKNTALLFISKVSSEFLYLSFALDDIYSSTDLTREFYPNFRHLIIGGARTGTNLHVDPKCTSAWNTLLVGRKKWILLLPGTDDEYLSFLGENSAVSHFWQFPGTREYLKQPPSYWWLEVFPKLKKQSKIAWIECIQEAGQTIYVPAGKWIVVPSLTP